jgi:poly-gamma-glutamate capsule biosynthesis protein CapA/YwtB (metallophosphatase superfamily)
MIMAIMGQVVIGVLLLFTVVFLPLVSHGCQETSSDSGDNHLTIVAVGDIMMGTIYPVDILPPEDGKGMFKPVQGEFQGGDVVFGNLEGSLCDEVTPMKCKGPLSGNCFEFVMPSRYTSHLKDAGFSVLNIANNHILDFGLEGAESTITNLRNAGIQATGGEMIASIQKSEKKIAVVGFSYKASPYAYTILEIPEAKEIVTRLKKSHDIVIVSFHGGAEGKRALHIPKGDEIFLEENRGNVVKFARAVVDAGADMVIGHGPHVLRAMEVYKGRLITYSLGNFLTYGLFNLKGPNSLSVILKARIDATTGNFLAGRLVPVRLINGGMPEIDPTGEAITLIKYLTATDIKPRSIVIEDNGVLRSLYK